jgi:DNA-binding response OmpR family regulator
MKTIILFEDEQAIVTVFRVSFERMGYKVLQAATFKEVTKIAEQYQPPIDLLIADMIVRVSTCVRVATALVRTRPQMAVLFISRLPPAELAHCGLMNCEMLKLPRLEVLQKPFLPWILEQHVRELIGV